MVTKILTLEQRSIESQQSNNGDQNIIIRTKVSKVTMVTKILGWNKSELNLSKVTMVNKILAFEQE